MIQDHIESVGKAILLKGDEVLLNGLLTQMLSDIAPNHSTNFSFQICPKPKVKLGPADSFYPEPSSSYDIATARNPSHFGLTERDLDLTEMGLQTLCFPS